MIYRHTKSLFFLALIFWACSLNARMLPAARKLKPRNNEGPKFVYRGDTRSSDTIKSQGGFQPRGLYQNGGPEVFSLVRHKDGAIHWADYLSDSDSDPGSDSGSEADSFDAKMARWKTAYVSTSNSAQIASNFQGSWVYKIRATPNIIDAGTTLGEDDEEGEFSALGGVLWSQVVGWMKGEDYDKLPNGPDEIPDDNLQRNPDYDEARFRDSVATLNWPPLSGKSQGAAATASDEFAEFRDKDLAESAKKFMDKVGSVVGWAGSFPLLKDPEGQPTSPQGAEADPGPSWDMPPEGVSVGDVLEELSPTKPFTDLAAAIRSNKPLSAGDWLSVLANVGLEIAAWVPTPAAPVAQALRFARAGYKASKSIRKVLKVASKVLKANKKPQVTIAKAKKAAQEIDEALYTVKVKMSKAPSNVPSTSGTQSIGEVAMVADKVKLPTKADPDGYEEFLKKLDDLKIPTDEPIGPVMQEAVKDVGKKVDEAVRLPSKRADTEPNPSLADDLDQLAAFKSRNETVPLDLLERVAVGLSSKLFESQRQGSLLDDNKILDSIADKVERAG